MLVASVASAKDPVPQIRNVTFPWRPDRLARLVYVAEEVATVLRFEKDVDLNAHVLPRARDLRRAWHGSVLNPLQHVADRTDTLLLHCC